jgi:hypothetical protein
MMMMMAFDLYAFDPSWHVDARSSSVEMGNGWESNLIRIAAGSSNEKKLCRKLLCLHGERLWSVGFELWRRRSRRSRLQWELLLIVVGLKEKLLQKYGTRRKFCGLCEVEGEEAAERSRLWSK